MDRDIVYTTELVRIISTDGEPCQTDCNRRPTAARMTSPRSDGSPRRLAVHNAEPGCRCLSLLALLLIPATDHADDPLGALRRRVCVASGELLRLWGVHHIGAISRTRSDRLGPLVDTRPFALVRNPLYLGNIALWVGFAVSARLRLARADRLALSRLRVSRDRAVGGTAARVAARRCLPRLLRRGCRAGCRRFTRREQRGRPTMRAADVSRGARRSSANAARSSRLRSATCCSGDQAVRRVAAARLRRSASATDTSDATDRYGRHASPIFSTRFGVGPLAQSVQPLHRVDDAEIADRQHVGPMQTEHQEHLGRPAPEPFHRHQPLDHRFVVERVELVELQPAVGDPRSTGRAGSRPSVRSARRRAAPRRRSPQSPPASGIASSGNSATKRPKIVAAAFVDSCWLTIAPTSAVR